MVFPKALKSSQKFSEPIISNGIIKYLSIILVNIFNCSIIHPSLLIVVSNNHLMIHIIRNPPKGDGKNTVRFCTGVELGDLYWYHSDAWLDMGEW